MTQLNLQCSCGGQVTSVCPIRQLKKLPEGSTSWQDAGFTGSCSNGCLPVVVTTDPSAEFSQGIVVLKENPPKQLAIANQEWLGAWNF